MGRCKGQGTTPLEHGINGSTRSAERSPLQAEVKKEQWLCERVVRYGKSGRGMDEWKATPDGETRDLAGGCGASRTTELKSKRYLFNLRKDVGAEVP
jgi:hypothetical protein